MKNLKTLQTYTGKAPFNHLTVRDNYDGAINFGKKSPEKDRLSYIYISRAKSFFDDLKPIWITIDDELGFILSSESLERIGCESYRANTSITNSGVSIKIALTQDIYTLIFTYLQYNYKNLNNINIDDILYTRLSFNLSGKNYKPNIYQLNLVDYKEHNWLRLRGNSNNTRKKIYDYSKKVVDEGAISSKEKESIIKTDDIVLSEANLEQCLDQIIKISPDGTTIKCEILMESTKTTRF